MYENLRVRSLLLAASVLLAGACGNGEGGKDDDVIAPNCDEAWCAEVVVDATLACDDPIGEKSFDLVTSFQGVTKELSCAGRENGDGGLDLMVGVSPAEGQSGGNYGQVAFLLRNYDGPGTYPLYNLSDEGNHEGLLLSGNISPDDGNHSRTVGTVECRESPCQAVVAEGSADAIPDDDHSTHEFRVRVEVQCTAGGVLTDMLCDDDALSCAFVSAPTLKFDLVCRN